MAIEIEVGADFRDLLQAFKRGEITMEEFEQALEGIGDAGRDAGDGVVEGADDATRSMRDVGDEARNVGDQLGEVGNIAKDALEGDLAGAADSALGTVAGVAGAIGGFAGTAVVGVTELVNGVIDLVVSSAEAAEEKVVSAFDAMVEAGGKALTAAQIDAAMQEIINDTERNNALKAQQIELGVNYGTLLRAEAGDQEALAVVLDAVNTRRAEAAAAVAEYTASSGGALDTASTKELANLQATQAEWDSKLRVLEEASIRYDDLTLGLNAATDGSSGLAGAINSIPTSTVIKVDVDKSEAERKIQEIMNRRYVISFDADINSKYGRSIV